MARPKVQHIILTRIGEWKPKRPLPGKLSVCGINRIARKKKKHAHRLTCQGCYNLIEIGENYYWDTIDERAFCLDCIEFEETDVPIQDPFKGIPGVRS